MQNLLLSISNYILTITINRPDKLNALNKATIQDLHDALKLHATDAEVKVVVITGAGTKAFVAGADIQFIRTINGDSENIVANA